MRQGRQNAEIVLPGETGGGAGSESPQRWHVGGAWMGNSIQQTSQIGTRESRGRSAPQREQEAGKSVQLKLSKGLRSTRTTARQRVVGDGGTSLTAMRESLWKTHLAIAQRPSGLPGSASIAQLEFRAPAPAVSEVCRKAAGKEKSSERCGPPSAAHWFYFFSDTSAVLAPRLKRRPAAAAMASGFCCQLFYQRLECACCRSSSRPAWRAFSSSRSC